MAATPPFDSSVAHRWFAVEFNNRAWDLVEAQSRTDDESADMVAAAHAALLHWKQVGTPLNELRGLVLLVSAYNTAGMGQPAVIFSRRLLELSGHTEGETPFDRASAHGAAAHALRVAGKLDEARAGYRTATAFANTLPEEERHLFTALYPEI